MESPPLACKNELAIENEHVLIRAAEISSFVTSLTIGPNSTFDLSSFEELSMTNVEEKEETLPTTPKVTTVRVSTGSRLEISDIRYMQDKIHQENEDRRIKYNTIKYLEERQKNESEQYKKLQQKLDRIREDAERKHKEKMDALQKRIEDALRTEREEENQYQNQRKELAANSRKIHEEQEKQREIMKQQIKKHDDSYITQEGRFVKILQSCSPELAPVVENYNKLLKDVKNFKDANKSSLEGTKNAIAKLEALYQSFLKDKAEFETQMQAKLAAQKEADEKRRQEEEAAKQAASNVPKPIVLIQPQHAVNQVTVEDSSHSKMQYEHFKQFLANLKNEINQLDTAQEFQQLRFAYKVVFNNPINQMNSEKNKMLEAYNTIFKLLSGQRISTSKGEISVGDFPQALNWCRLKIAEKLIDRCDKDSGTTFHVAAIAISLWQKFPEFGEIFKAVLYMECPFFIPYKPQANKTQSNQDFMQSWGFKIGEKGCETHKSWEARTAKYAALLASLWVTHPRTGEPPNPFGIEHAWTYLATVFNNKPDENYLHILEKILEIAGSALHQTFKGQFLKLMIFIRDSYMPAVQGKIDEETGGSFNRLRDIVVKFFNDNKLPEPKGKLAPGYW